MTPPPSYTREESPSHSSKKPMDTTSGGIRVRIKVNPTMPEKNTPMREHRISVAAGPASSAMANRGPRMEDSTSTAPTE